jgi:hypothetical protein
MPFDGAHIRSEVSMDRSKQSSPHEATPPDSLPRRPNGELEDDSTLEPNPPRTTKDGMTAPKFGSAGSGGAELEPGPERD